MSDLIVVIGAPGVGKTTVCNRFKETTTVISSDREKDLTITAVEKALKCGSVLLDLSMLVGKTLDALSRYNPVVLLINENEQIHRARLESRGGAYTDSVAARAKRLSTIAANLKADADKISRRIDYEFLKKTISLPEDGKMLIYKATSPSGKIYVGSTVHSLAHRIMRHYYASIVENEQYLFMNALRKYRERIKWEIVEECTKDQLSSREIYWIESLNSRDPSFGYNLTAGGSGWLGRAHSDETKAIISAKHKGRPAHNKGKPSSYKMTEKHREAVVAANTGRERSEDQIRAFEAHNADRSWVTEEVLRKQRAGGFRSIDFQDAEWLRKVTEANTGANNGFFGKKHSEDTKIRMRQPKTDEHKLKVAEARSTGKIIDGNGVEYVSKKHYRKIHSLSASAVEKLIACGKLKFIPKN